MKVLAAPLRRGDTIGIVSPSGAFQGREPQWVRMKDYLEGLGFVVAIGAYAQKISGYTAGTDTERLLDFHAMWSDPNVRGILCSQGGYGSMRLLEKLDYKLIAQRPKVLMGYSDNSALLLAIHSQSGLVGFHGPMAVSDFGKEQIDNFTAQHCWPLLTGSANQSLPYSLPNACQPFYRTLRPGIAEGPLFAGNLQLLSSLVGTPYLPDLTGAILLIEDVGGYIYLLDRMMTQLQLSGTLQKLSGLLFGEFIHMMGENPIIPLNITGAPSIPELLQSFADTLSIPVGYGFSCGHSEAKTTFPIGVQARFDADAGSVSLLEAYMS